MMNYDRNRNLFIRDAVAGLLYNIWNYSFRWSKRRFPMWRLHSMLQDSVGLIQVSNQHTPSSFTVGWSPCTDTLCLSPLYGSHGL